jgi:putative endonuclease
MDKNYYVYILTNKKDGILYIGVANNLERRIYEHKQEMVEGFSKKYNLKKLVYFEETGDIKSAIAREKCLKRWNRKWKTKLIKKKNPGWEDLTNKFLLGVPGSPPSRG